jgi:hypothetical protein
VLNGAHTVNGPLFAHTSIGWTVITWLTATDAAKAAPEIRQAAADKRQSHDAARISPRPRSLILHLPLRAPNNSPRFPAKCEQVHTAGDILFNEPCEPEG